MNEQKYQKISISLPYGLWADLCRYCSAHDSRMSPTIAQAVADFLDAQWAADVTLVLSGVARRRLDVAPVSPSVIDALERLSALEDEALYHNPPDGLEGMDEHVAVIPPVELNAP